MRGLRTRLMVAYALFFAVFISGLVFVLRATVLNKLDEQAHEKVTEEWQSVKGGYLRIEPGSETSPIAGQNGANWYYDDKDPDETTAVLDIKKIFLLTDPDGNVLLDAATGDRQVSSIYDNIGIPKAEDIRARVKEAQRVAQTQKAGIQPKGFWEVREDG